MTKREIEDNVLLQKIEDMMLYAFPAVDKMKRPERGYGGTGTAIRIAMITMGERAVDAKRARMPKSRLKALDDIDAEISRLKFLLKYALRAELLSFKQYDQISEKLDECGKILGGWIQKVIESEEYRKETTRKR